MARGWAAEARDIEPPSKHPPLHRSLFDAFAPAPVHLPGMIMAAKGDMAILTDMRLKDLEEWWHLRGLCRECFRSGRISRRRLERQRGADVPVSAWRKDLLCTGCGNKDDNQFSVFKMPR